MIHFIIGEDNTVISQKIMEVIDQVMLKNNMASKSFCFYDYDQSFIDKMEENLPNKIYILDIETPTRSGIEVARMIREKDINCSIIFITAYKNKYKETIYESEFLSLGIVSKQDDYEDVLALKIQKALTFVSRKNAIRFEDQGCLYTIPTKDILYITTDTQDRKCLIITDNNCFRINKPMYEIVALLDEYFVKTHRACVVNKERIVCYDFKNRIIQFDNLTSIDLVSRDLKKKLYQELRADTI